MKMMHCQAGKTLGKGNKSNKTSTATRPAIAGNPLDERVGVRCHRKQPSVPPSTLRVDTAGRVKQYPLLYSMT